MKAAAWIALAVLGFSSCKKDRQCECKNENGSYYAGDVEATRHQAKKYCKSLSEGSTDCYLKK